MQNTDALTRLALDLGWSWNHSADEIWKRLDSGGLGVPVVVRVGGEV
jgi:hypothetical protein